MKARVIGSWISITEDPEGEPQHTSFPLKSIQKIVYQAGDEVTTVTVDGEELEFNSTEAEHGFLLEAVGSCPMV